MGKYLTATFTLPNGKRKYIRAATKTELAKKLAAAKTEAGLGIDISDTTTVKEYAENWLRLTKTGRVSANTEAHLRARLKNHIYPYIGSMRIRDVRASHILNVVQHCSGKSRGLQSAILGNLRAIFNAVVDDETFANWLKERRRSASSVFVFPNSRGGCYSGSAFDSAWHTAASRVDFPVRPHQLRHTYITTLFEAGLDIKEIQRVVGHADPSVTLRVYTHYREAQRSQSTAKKVREALG